MEPISSSSFPELSIPLSMGVRSEDLVFVSGQGPLDLETGEVVGETIEDQTRVTLNHVVTILAAADLDTDAVVSVTAYLVDADDYDGFNAAYREYFTAPFPARSCLVTDLLHEGMRVEIKALARA